MLTRVLAGWAAIIAAEVVAARSGLGYLIANGMEILRADKVLVGMGILGVCFDAFFRFLHRALSRSERDLCADLDEELAKSFAVEAKDLIA